jgi:hypothetical protein
VNSFLTSKGGLALFAFFLCACVHAENSRTLDDFENLTQWKVQHTDDVTASLDGSAGKYGKALRLTFDFDHVNGYATAHRSLPLELPANYEISFWVRGDAPVNNLQFKLIDASGENVWWLNRPDFEFPREWQQVRVRKRQIEFAWGPTQDRELKHSVAIEFVVASGRDGGKGSVAFDELTIRALPPEDNPPLPPTPNELLQAAAKNAPRGTYPRGFVEQVYWTIVGVDGGGAPALISEDGAIEPRKGSWSIEPFLVVGDRRLTWADVITTQSLLDGYLPLPAVQWKTDTLQLDVETFASGTRESAQLVARYRLRNISAAPVAATLHLAIRPLQVDPPMQFLNSPGGVGSIKTLRWRGKQLDIDDAHVTLSAAPDAFERLGIDGQLMRTPAVNEINDGSGQLSVALVYKFQLPAGAEQEVDVAVPMRGSSVTPTLDPDDVEREHNAVAAQWRARLNRVTLKSPDTRIANALRTALAHILISRDGANLRPGTRSYARSWIRDGAMMSDALLRLGETDAVREYVNWYAPHQFSNGKVPCCVDYRGADPVPENDSHGELIHAIAQLYRYSGGRTELKKQWPHVEAAIAYMEKMRAGETGVANPAFTGLLPASISHEGYSAKPMHSYWDDFWALTGYQDAAEIAHVLGTSEAARYAQTRDGFANDLRASIAAAMKQHAIEFVPGSVELGDFDATSTTIALAPADAQALLPDDSLRNTFERYWREFVARRDGAKTWEDYTPYEWRVVGSFARLGWRDRAQAALDFFFATGARPAAWNQWAEVVGRDPRKPRFIGDMPHAWVASDFVRSALDLFAYERGDTLVLAAGVPPSWVDGEGIAIQHLRTAYGELSYRLQRSGHLLMLHIDGDIKPPGGFLLPWPLSGKPGITRINNAAAQWRGEELLIASAPARITVELGKD